MGFRVAWIARAGESLQELLSVSDRTLTGECHDFPERGWYLLEIRRADRQSWVVLIADGSDNFCDLSESQAQTLSENSNETIFFCCTDTAMATRLTLFKNGSLSWSIDYECSNKQRLPVMKGVVPEVTHEILKDLRAKQQVEDLQPNSNFACDHIYDLTAELGWRLVGFRHDTDLEVGDPRPFQLLGESKPMKPWWRIWNR